MTKPYLMNCPHSDDGWCLDCVKKLWEEYNPPEPETEPVMKDGALQNFMLSVNGKSFRCECACNVFHKPDKNRPELYECNGCKARFIGE